MTTLIPYLLLWWLAGLIGAAMITYQNRILRWGDIPLVLLMSLGGPITILTSIMISVDDDYVIWKRKE